VDHDAGTHWEITSRVHAYYCHRILLDLVATFDTGRELRKAVETSDLRLARTRRNLAAAKFYKRFEEYYPGISK
jgi:hypothetical protein